MNELQFYKVSAANKWGYGLIKYEILIEFINCLNTPVMGRYIRNLSNMYVLVGHSDLLNFDEIIIIEKYGGIILAFMLMDNTTGPYHTIEYIWTRESVRKKGLARQIISKYEQLFDNIKAIPGEVASGFWKRYFVKTFGINSLHGLLEFKKCINIPTLRWDLLEARYKYTDEGIEGNEGNEGNEYKLLSTGDD